MKSLFPRKFLHLKLHDFFISNTFISHPRLKLAKNQANAKQQPEAELSLYENYSLRQILKNRQNNRCICVHEIIRLIIIKMKMKTKKRKQIRHKQT